MRGFQLQRKTKETDVLVEIELDGNGESEISTQIPFFDHMLGAFAFHSKINLKIEAMGDIEVDHHHTIEDVGITLGKAIRGSLEDYSNINRFGWAIVPLDEALALCSIDISGRGFLSFDVEEKFLKQTPSFDFQLIKEFFRALSYNGMFTLHVKNLAGENLHHIFESIFKAFALAFKSAILRVENGIASTKGIIV